MAVTVRDTWRGLSPEQRAAGLGSLLLIVSTLGPFSFVEAAQVLVAVAVLALLLRRSQGREFHLPFGDGTVIAAAGVWCGVLIAIRLFDRSLGLALFALGCATLMVAAGLREHSRRPADDTPHRRRGGERPTWLDDDPPVEGPRRWVTDEAVTRPLAADGTPGVARAPNPDDQRTLPLPTERADLPDVDEPPELDFPR